ncbi:hypothetical protein D3C72_1618630 [compost metagenome]
MLPKCLSIPGTSGRVPKEALPTEDIIFGLYGPASYAWKFLLCIYFFHLTHAIDIIEVRPGRFTQISDFCRPIVHLYIDIGMVI